MSKNIEIIVKVDGKKVPLNTISVETFKKIKKLSKDKYEDYCEKHRVYGETPTIIKNPYYTPSPGSYCSRLIRVPLPNANTTWTLAVFDWVKAFINWTILNHQSNVSIVHGKYAPDNKAIYIRIPGIYN